MIEPGKTCSHGKKWDEPCEECALISAHDLVAHWGEAVDRARILIAEYGRRDSELVNEEVEF